MAAASAAGCLPVDGRMKSWPARRRPVIVGAVSLNFEELDFAETRFGELILRRRRVLSLDRADVYEVKLDGSFLMSSLVNASEIALAELGLAALEQPPGSGSTADGWDVVVGGLGLGYTAATALEDDRVGSLLVLEYLAEVIAWHEQGLVPLGEQLGKDERCRLIQGDFFALAAEPEPGFDSAAPGRRFHAVLLDIDHSPDGLLHSSHAALYQPQGLRRLALQLHPGGVFALWSAEPPDEVFAGRLEVAFVDVQAHAVTFFNPLLDRDDTNTVYVCRVAAVS